MTRRSFLGLHHLLPWLTSWVLLLWPGTWVSGQEPADSGLDAASFGIF